MKFKTLRWVCWFCGKKFRREWVLALHIYRKHWYEAKKRLRKL